MPGTGSAFALLPPDNATGNFIHITERVPVRIALPQDEIREHPLRPGLSTVTKIHVGEQGNSVWTSLVRPDTAEYQTDVYGDELTSAESSAQGKMQGNLVVKDIGGHTQRLGSETTERIDRLGSDTTRIPEDPSSAFLHRHEKRYATVPYPAA